MKRKLMTLIAVLALTVASVTGCTLKNLDVKDGKGFEIKVDEASTLIDEGK